MFSGPWALKSFHSRLLSKTVFILINVRQTFLYEKTPHREDIKIERQGFVDLTRKDFSSKKLRRLTFPRRPTLPHPTLLLKYS